MKIRMLLPLLALLPLAACDDTDAEAGVVEPSIDGKSDEFSGVIDGGSLRFGETVDGSFDEDFQFFEYTFRARENAVLDIEITQAGSSRALDTTLFLYRNNAGGGAPSRIAFDDDEGWGSLSRIRDFRLYSEGEYTIVVGTKGATGRGDFRLSLGCDGEACTPQTPTAECHPALQQSLEECFIEVGQYESDFEIAAYELIEECREWVGYATESVCPDDDEPLCEDSEPFEDACYVTWEADYVRPATGLTEDNDGGLEAFIEQVHDSETCDLGEDAGCWTTAKLYRYEGEAPSPAAVLAFARETSDVGPGAFLDQTLESDVGQFSELTARYDATDAFEAFLEDAGLDLSEASVATTDSFGEIQWNWGECNGGMVTATFPSAQRVLVIQDMICWG